MNIYTNLLFSVAFSCSCWRPGEPDPAGGDQYQLCPSNQELWRLHHLQANLFWTSGILFPLSLDQTNRKAQWVKVYDWFQVHNHSRWNKHISCAVSHLRVMSIIHRFSFIFHFWVFQGCSCHSQGGLFIAFCHSSTFNAESHLNISTRWLWNIGTSIWKQLSSVYLDNLFRIFLPARTSWFPLSSSSQSKALPISVTISALMCVGRVCVSGGCVK